MPDNLVPFPQPQPQSPLPSLQLNMMQDRMVVAMVLGNGLSITQELPSDIMEQIITKWLETHPALLQQLAQQALEIKRNELQLIRHVNSHRND
jgi:hypothetical protein